MTDAELLNELIARFPELQYEDADMNGGDAVDALNDWFFSLGGEKLPGDGSEED